MVDPPDLGANRYEIVSVGWDPVRGFVVETFAPEPIHWLWILAINWRKGRESVKLSGARACAGYQQRLLTTN